MRRLFCRVIWCMLVAGMTVSRLYAAESVDLGFSYKKIIETDDPIRNVFGESRSPSAIVVSGNRWSNERHAVLLLDGTNTIRRIETKDSGIEAIGASDNGDWLAIARRNKVQGKEIWDVTLTRRFESKAATHIQVSENGSTVLLIDAGCGWPEKGLLPSIRTYDQMGRLIGEFENKGKTRYEVMKCRLTSDGSRIIVPKITIDGGATSYSLTMLDRSLKELWSFDLKIPDSVNFAINEESKRIVVCATGRESCWLLDFEGKVLSVFKTDVGGILHFPSFSQDANIVAVRGGYDLEVFKSGSDRAAWRKKPPAGLRQYDVTSADVSPDGKYIVAAFCQIMPGKQESIKAPRYVVLYDTDGNKLCEKEFSGNDYTSMSGPDVKFTRNGDAIIVQEEKSIGILKIDSKTKNNNKKGE